jgi:hypothetical protein
MNTSSRSLSHCNVDLGKSHYDPRRGDCILQTPAFSCVVFTVNKDDLVDVCLGEVVSNTYSTLNSRPSGIDEYAGVNLG